MADIEKLYVNWNQTESMVDNLIHQMYKDNWKPEYIVGITRGGLVPAIMMSHKTGIMMHTLDVRLRDGKGNQETNTWMSEDAFGTPHADSGGHGKNILIVDDINDTGETVEWIKKDWQSSCLPNHSHWNNVWNHSVKFAVLYENESSKVASDYFCKTVNKFEKDVWIVYPWESQYG